MGKIEEKIRESRERSTKATKGPWHVNYRSPEPGELMEHRDYRPQDRFHSLYPLSWTGRNLKETVTDDWEFIAAARTWEPRFRDALEVLFNGTTVAVDHLRNAKRLEGSAQLDFIHSADDVLRETRDEIERILEGK